MTDSNNLLSVSVCCLHGGDELSAGKLAERLGVSLTDKADQSGITVIYDSEKVSLAGYGLTYSGDFSSMLRRIDNGKIKHEMIYRISKTNATSPVAVDATAGMGDDSILLAACGYKVYMFERDPIIAELLRDTVRRASSDIRTADLVSRMIVSEGNSIDLMSSLNEIVDFIFLDPMFPERKKSGLINKKLQLIQKLEHPCENERELFDAAVRTGTKKIAVKRPLKGPYLAGMKPGYSVSGKAIRYDCYYFNK